MYWNVLNKHTSEFFSVMNENKGMIRVCLIVDLKFKTLMEFQTYSSRMNENRDSFSSVDSLKVFDET